ncbi:MAG: SDR family NAD(P)-dependent oxidoreductase [Acidimicrobiales bacterium]
MADPGITRLDGRVAMVTGSNTGIGKATATALAAAGATVVLACRSEAKTTPVVDEIRRATGNDDVSFLALDLADLAATKRSAAEWLDGGRPLHLLVNNAGLAGQRGLTADGFELAFGVNHLGHFLFTTELLPLLRSSTPARVVNVSSGNHFRPKRLDLDTVRESTDSFVGLRAYDRSKLCNVLFTMELATRHDPAQLSSFAVNPGQVASDVWRRLPRPAALAYQRLARMKTTEAGARSSVFCTVEPGLEAQSGSYFDEDCARRDVNPVATPELAATLWERSEEWVAPFR